MAPEIILNKGHNKAADWWAFGVLIYEMIAGFPPFYTNDDDIFKIYKKILKARFTFDAEENLLQGQEQPKFTDDTTKEFISGLLTISIPQRLGCGIVGDVEIKSHAWYNDINWEDIEKKKLAPPIIPQINENQTDEDTTKYFDDYDSEDVEGQIFAQDDEILTPQEQKNFCSW